MAEPVEQAAATPAERTALDAFNDRIREVVWADGSYPTAMDLGTLEELRLGKLASGGVVIRAEEPFITEEMVPEVNPHTISSLTP